jgi:hypothetical protein
MRSEQQHRFMELGRAFATPIEIAGVGKLLIDRLRDEVVLFPEISTRLVGYMAWPNDAEARTAWLRAHGTSRSESLPSAKSDQPLRIIEAKALKEFYKGMIPIQKRWARVADILHYHFDLRQGGHQIRRGGASLGKAIHIIGSNATSVGTGNAKLWEAWKEYKDVGHLVTAAILLTAEAKVRGFRHLQMQPARVVMLVPELVLAVGMSFESYGLRAEVHGRDEPLLDPNALWRIPDDIGIASIDPPTRKIRPSELKLLNARRAGHRGKGQSGRKATPVSGSKLDP